FIGPNVTATADRDVAVQATSAETVTAVIASASGAGATGVFGTGGADILTLTTQAALGADPRVVAIPTNGAHVHATGNVLVAADANDTLNILAGNGGAAGTTSIGAATAIPILTKTTQAFIGARASVTADGVDGSAPITIPTRAFQVVFGAPSGNQ